MKTICIAVLTFLAAANSFAQTDGMLWRVSGNGLKNASYLFGTIHLYCNHENIYKQEIRSAMDSSDIVAMELNLNDFNTLVALMKSGMKESGKSLKTMLTPAEYILVDSVCRLLTTSSLESLDNKSPLTVISHMIVSEKFIGCQGPLPVDLTIADMAKRSKKMSYGLESFQFQDSLLSSIPDTTQVRWLLEFCRDIPKAQADFTAMLAAYETQQSNTLYDVMFKTSPEMAMFNDLLLVQRNIRWVQFLQDNMKANVYFMAVGAGHLGGKDGLVSLLRTAGYTVTPLQIK